MGRKRRDGTTSSEPRSALRLSLKVRHAVRALIALGTEGRGRPLSAREIASREGMSTLSLHQILFRLMRAGIVKGARGPAGGYVLAADPERVTLADVVRAVEGPVALTKCTNEQLPRPRCERERECGARPLWERLNRLILDALDGITLADVLREAREAGAEARGPREATRAQPAPASRRT